jgi:ADP-heptose:LPS heptosyltransferase
MSAGHVLVVRLDSMGDMLICGPAIRAVAAGAERTTVLASPIGAAAARLLPGVDDVIEWSCPWITAGTTAVDPSAVRALVDVIAARRIDRAVILTSFHQSALPTALVLRLAGIRWIAAASEDYPGGLLDVRAAEPADAPEPERMLAVVRAAGFELPAGDDGRLRIALLSDTALADTELPDTGLPDGPYVVIHPGASAPARAYPESGWRDVVAALTGRGWCVVLTGTADERSLTASLASAARSPGQIDDRAGRLGLVELAHLLRRARGVIVGNTGPAHLAAAVGTPVVSLFAPVVPARRWAPYGTNVVVLGDQSAPCRNSRARECPVPGHPCLSSVAADQVLAALDELVPSRPEIAAVLS